MNFAIIRDDYVLKMLKLLGDDKNLEKYQKTLDNIITSEKSSNRDKLTAIMFCYKFLFQDVLQVPDNTESVQEFLNISLDRSLYGRSSGKKQSLQYNKPKRGRRSYKGSQNTDSS